MAAVDGASYIRISYFNLCFIVQMPRNLIMRDEGHVYTLANNILLW